MSDRITQIIKDTGTTFGWSHEATDILASRIRAAHEKEVADLKARAGLLNERIADLEADNLELQERVKRLEDLASALLIVARERNPRRLSEEDYEGWSHAVVNDAEQFLQPDAADKGAEVTKIVPTGTEGAKLSEYGVAKLIAEHFDMKESPVQSKDGAFLRRNFKINIIDTERERMFELRVWSEGHE